MLLYGKCECFVMQMLYACDLCASCGSSQCCVLNDFQFVNAGRGCNRRPYGRGILQSRPHNCLVDSHECLLLFTPYCSSECFYDLLRCSMYINCVESFPHIECYSDCSRRGCHLIELLYYGVI